MGIALFYQYYLDYAPCVLCVHIRVWVIAIGLVSLTALLVSNRIFRWIAFLAGASFLAFFALDVYELWQIEAGHKMGECSWSAGFPESLPLNEWIPSLFEIGGICGESPTIMFGITMAESLMSVGGILIMFFCLSLLITLRDRFLKTNNG